MNPFVKRMLAVFGGLMAGSIINMSIIVLSDKLVSPPPGTDLTTLEGLKASMHLFTPINFLMPFLAHAMGSLFGAFVAVKIDKATAFRSAMIVGIAFMGGGIVNCIQLPAPLWFEAADTLLAYIPFAYAGYFLAKD